MRKWLEAGLVLGGLVLAYFFLQEHTDRIRAEAAQQPLRNAALNARREAQERDDSLAAVRGRAQALATALEASTRLAERLSDSLSAAVTEDEVIVDVAVADLGALFEQIRANLPEPARPLVDSAQVRVTALAAANTSTAEAFRVQAASFAAFRVQSEAAFFGVTARAAAAEASIETWKVVAAREAARAENAERLATRGVWARVKASIPLLSLPATIGAGVGVFGTLAVLGALP